jgi:UDP-N-acetylmuramyl pentapeptide phosphotransferase/UDP-N-acetylglucosamine-1-phosphate transferase
MSLEQTWPFWGALGFAVPAVAAVLTAGLILLLRPVLIRYALARPNARSSHREPTPQGGGVAVVAATISVSLIATQTVPVGPDALAQLVPVFAATILISFVGAVDDIHALHPAIRLPLHAVAVATVLLTLPSELRVFQSLPLWADRALLVIGGVWFVNLVNFMDGIDWMTVAEMVPLTAALALAGWLGALPLHAAVVTLALLGALLGFAPFNRPVARLFLGDVGSLPIGLITGWLLVLFAANGHLAAALILPLYYLADSGITLMRRLFNGERLWQAHRTHFYQRATDNGLSVNQVVARVFAINIALAALAIATVLVPSAVVPAIAVAAALVGWLMLSFSRRRHRAEAA